MLKSVLTCDFLPQLFSGDLALTAFDVADHYIILFQFRSSALIRSSSVLVPFQCIIPFQCRFVYHTVSSLSLCLLTYRLRPLKLRSPGRCRCPVIWHFAYICIYSHLFAYNRIYSHIIAFIVYPMYLLFALDLKLTAALLSVYLVYFLLLLIFHSKCFE